jgi:lipopolysaccharide export system protein LptA
MKSLMIWLMWCVMVPHGALAQQGMVLDTNQPVEIIADTLEVLQAQQKAIFSGNVLATQGDINMKSDKMVVYYHNASATESAPGEGIHRIEAFGNVLFTTPSETAQGDNGVYHVDTNTIDLTGNVLLTREKNVLKGTKLTYNIATGRSVLNSAGGSTQGGRVRGLFLPGSTSQGATQ